ncbi:ABC transporter substrate-binding protein [Gemmatimonadota bacterium Y43]
MRMNLNRKSAVRSTLRFAPGLALAIALSALATAVSAQAPSTLRVVSLGGSTTETVFALGAEGLLVGVDQSSIYPAAAEALPDVGYYRTLGTEGILSLAPDLVLAAEGSGPPAVLAQLRAAGVTVVAVPGGEHPRAAIDKVRIVAAALGRASDGEVLEASIQADLERLAAMPLPTGVAPRALFVWGRGGQTMQVAGSATGAQAMLELAGAANAIQGFEGYRPLTPEAVVAAAPEVIVIDADLLDRLGGVAGLASDPALAVTPAVQAGRVVPIDVLGFLGFGPRTAELAIDLRRALAER